MTLAFRKSPTLELAAAIERARSAGQTVFSLSTPTFHDQRIGAPAQTGLRTTLSPEKGFEALREKARASLFPKWQLPEHECVVTGGAKAAIFSVLRANLSPSDRVLIISPHWPTYEDLARLAFLETRFLVTRSEDHFAIDPEALRDALLESAAKAVICSNPGNPSGKIHSAEELAALNTATEEAGAIFIIDESFSNIVFEPEKWRNAVCGESANLFVINSFSKNYHLQGLRLGASLLPKSSVPAVVSAHQTVLSAAPTPSQHMALSMIDGPGADVGDYSEQRRLMLEFITECGWPHISTEGSFYVFPRISNIDALRQTLESHSVLSLPGETFGESYREHTRICFGKPVEEVQLILDIMERSLSSKRGEVA